MQESHRYLDTLLLPLRYVIFERSLKADIWLLMCEMHTHTVSKYIAQPFVVISFHKSMPKHDCNLASLEYSGVLAFYHIVLIDACLGKAPPEHSYK